MLNQIASHGPRRLLVATVALTVITLSTALAAFSYGGLALEGKKANFRDEPGRGATSKTAQENADPVSRAQRAKDITQKLEEAPEIVIQFDNSTHSPLVIEAASIKAVKAPLSDPRLPPNLHLVSPDVQVQSATNRRVTGLVLSFTCECAGADKTCMGVGGLDLTQGAEYRFKMKPKGGFFTLNGDPNRLRVRVAAVLLEGEDLWVNVNETGVRLQGTLAVRSDSRFSKPSSSTEATSSGPEEAIQSEPRGSVVSAKIVTDVLCDGSGCPLSLIKNLGEIIGLPVVFEAAAEARLQSASAIYLRNLRRGDLIEIIMRLNNLKYSRAGNQLNVQYQNAPESLYRLNLSN